MNSFTQLLTQESVWVCLKIGIPPNFDGKSSFPGLFDGHLGVPDLQINPIFRLI